MLLSEKMVAQGNFLFKHRGTLPVIILIPALWLAYARKAEGSLVEEPLYVFLCYAISLLGLLIRIYTVGHSSPNTSGRNTSEGQVADSVNSTGIYSQCRHPLYIGNFFMWLGIAGLTFHAWFLLFFVVSYFFYYERIILAEENFLSGKFSSAYKEMADRVPAIIPKFSGWQKNSNAFSVKKVIRQEKTGILLLNGLFLLFVAIKETSLDAIWNNHPFWVVLLLASIVYYMIIKFLQKTTSLLN